MLTRELNLKETTPTTLAALERELRRAAGSTSSRAMKVRAP